MSRSGVRSCGISNRKQSGAATFGQLILVVIVLAVAAVFGYRYLGPQEGGTTVSGAVEADQQAEKLARETVAEPTSRAVTGAQANAASSVGEVVVADSDLAPGLIAPPTPVQPVMPRVRENAPVPVYDLAHAQGLVRGLAQFAPPDGELLSADIEEINRMLEDLKRQGPAAVAAIEEFLAAGADVDFADWGDIRGLPNSTLRLALMDTLGQIGGRDALDAMARMLPATIDPREITSLAEGLEANTPGVYRTDIADTTRSILALALESDANEFRDLGHLFGVIQAYGDDAMAADLEEIYRTTDSAWGNYALMALSRLPDGQGVPYVVAIANELAADPNRNASGYTMALRMLAQASREDPQAGDLLLQLAQGGTVDSAALVSVASTLGGREYQMITAGSEIAKKSKAATFLNGRAPETWTNEEIDQRLDLIDQFLRADEDPAVVQALNKSQDRLLVWKARSMINGKRVTQ